MKKDRIFELVQECLGIRDRADSGRRTELKIFEGVFACAFLFGSSFSRGEDAVIQHLYIFY